MYERLYRTSYLTVIINTSICRISNNFTVSVAITQDPNLPTSPSSSLDPVAEDLP
jgi:hypothetical protein